VRSKLLCGGGKAPPPRRPGKATLRQEVKLESLNKKEEYTGNVKELVEHAYGMGIDIFNGTDYKENCSLTSEAYVEEGRRSGSGVQVAFEAVFPAEDLQQTQDASEILESYPSVLSSLMMQVANDAGNDASLIPTVGVIGSSVATTVEEAPPTTERESSTGESGFKPPYIVALLVLVTILSAGTCCYLHYLGHRSSKVDVTLVEITTIHSPKSPGNSHVPVGKPVSQKYLNRARGTTPPTKDMYQTDPGALPGFRPGKSYVDSAWSVFGETSPPAYQTKNKPRSPPPQYAVPTMGGEVRLPGGARSDDPRLKKPKSTKQAKSKPGGGNNERNARR